MKLYGDNLKEGDVLMTNSPHAGGSYVILYLYMHLLKFNFMLATSRI